MASGFTGDVFALVDSNDAAGFAALFSAEGRLRFANGEPMVGPEAIEAGVQGFFTTVGGLRHTILREWIDGQDYVIELSVDYERLDGKSATIPVVAIWQRGENGLIDDYRVYFDLAPVYA